MIRIFVFIFLIWHTIILAEDLDKKIQETSEKIKDFKKNYNNINDKIVQSAKKILEQRKILYEQKKEIKRLEDTIEHEKTNYQKATEELIRLEKEQESIDDNKTKTEQKLIFIIANNITLTSLLNNQKDENIKSLMMSEVIKDLVKQTKDSMKKLDISYKKLATRSLAYSKNIKKKLLYIDSIKKQKTSLQSYQIQIKDRLQSYKNEKQNYKNELNTISSQKQKMQNILASLNVTKQEIEEQKKEEQRAREREKRNRRNSVSDKNLPTVKQHGSSYLRVQTKKYKGRKTISPLSNYTITKEYGPYVDPVYHIKIFNESIALKPKNGKDKVRNVFNGKIILLNENNMLKNVIVVQHDNGLHTIYASIDKVAPNLKVGQKIRKGTIIGRVQKELLFEVTQKGYHIDPSELF